MNLARVLADYDYRVPRTRIALSPAVPRDAARLLVFDRSTGRVRFDTFKRLGRHLPPRSLIVLNDTRVVPARLTLTKPTGGKVRLLYVGHTDSSIRALTSSAIPAGTTLTFARGVTCRVLRQHKNFLDLAPSFPMQRLFAVLERYGTTPLPLYLRHSPLSESQRKHRYQTVFAKVRGSVAAPTASLHLTKPLLRYLRQAGHGISYVTLHVNLGTFAPLNERNLRTSSLHVEHYEIPANSVKSIRSAVIHNRPIVAVGTTVVRALESSFNRRGDCVRTRGSTRLFIRPGYRFKIVNGMITNFHVPRSSLLMLVAAFIGKTRLFRLYDVAEKKRFRFYSFGDGMLLLNHDRSRHVRQ